MQQRAAAGRPMDEGASGLLAALLKGDESAFATLIDRYHASLVRVASVYCRDRQIAEEVAQEAWLGFLQGLPKFERRSSLKTWLFGILVNCARTRARREGRVVTLSLASELAEESFEPSVDPSRFRMPDDPRWPGHWAVPPTTWANVPEEQILSAETRTEVRRAIARLPVSQREVITLRDIEGWTAEEVGQVLGITAGNQRVLLHRARSQVRRALEDYFGEAEA